MDFAQVAASPGSMGFGRSDVVGGLPYSHVPAGHCLPKNQCSTQTPAALGDGARISR